MTVSLADMKTHLNVTTAADDEVIATQIEAAKRHIERLLGFRLDDVTQFPEGAPADLDQAVKMLAAHFYENREASIAGVSLAPIPFGVAEIVNEHRTYTFG